MLKKMGILLPVRDASCRYRSPAFRVAEGKLGAVGGIGEVLGLQTHAHPGDVVHAALAAFGVQEVAAVELDARLLRPGLHGDAAAVPGETAASRRPWAGERTKLWS